MPVKILILSHSFYPAIGGIESLSDIFAVEFMKLGCEVKIVTWSPDSTGKEFSYSIIRNPSHIQLIYAHLWADVIFENNICVRLGWPNFIFRKPSIIVLQTWITSIKGSIGWQNQFKIRYLKLAKQVVACSEKIRDRCYLKSIVIGNPYKETIFKELPGCDRTNDFIFVGRLVSDKGADFAIQAYFNLLNNVKLPNSNSLFPSLTIVGEGPEWANLHRLVDRLNLNNNINFKGALRGEALVKCLNHHSYLLVPSLWEEPFGIVALEGMACGCLPIVSDGGGLPEAIGEAGFLFRRGDVKDLTRCMKMVIDNPNILDDYKLIMREHVKSYYSSEISKRYLSLIKNLL